MNKFICMGIVLVYTTIAFAQKEIPEYSILKLPKDLLENANAVKRNEILQFEVKEFDKATLYVKVAITVLNDKGIEYADFEETYSKLHTISDIEGRLYDKFGNKIKSIKRADIEDISGTSGMNLADDIRVKRFSFNHRDFPYTVEYEYKEDFKTTMFYPPWVPVGSSLLSVQNSMATYTTKKNLPINFKELNYTKKAIVTEKDDNIIYAYELTNFKAIQREYLSPSWPFIVPIVYASPTKFKIEDAVGSFSTWKDFGLFQEQLNIGKDVLPTKVKEDIKTLTANLTTDAEKVQVLYKYMQQNTRYISIQLGIGGWQPFDATYVANNKFGDCKALSNYMKALLKEVGIAAKYTIIKAGESNKFINADLPSSQFNHVILMVPLANKDSIWLECTSQNSPTGYLGGFTHDRMALVVDGENTKLVQTPIYTENENKQVRKITATLTEEGMATIQVATTYAALQQDDLYNMLKTASKEKVLETLKSELSLAQYDVIDYNYESKEGKIPIVLEKLQLQATNYASTSGSRIFLEPNMLTKTSRKLTIDSARKYAIVADFGYTDIDTVQIKVPAGYIAEMLPKPIHIDNKFGVYTTACTYNQATNTITYSRMYQHKKNTFPATDYNAYVQFVNTAFKEDRSRVVLKKQ